MVERTIETESLTTVHWLGLGLAAITGLIHLGMGLAFFPDPLAIAFVLAGLGFATGIGLFLLAIRRRLLTLLGIPFVAAQIVSWYVLNRPTLDTLGPGEAVDKVVQLALIVVLVLLLARDGDSA